jgi:hypothetical protein
MPKSFEAHRQALVLSPDTPYWVIDLMDRLEEKDVVDIINALEWLVELYGIKFREMQEQMRE